MRKERKRELLILESLQGRFESARIVMVNIGGVTALVERVVSGHAEVGIRPCVMALFPFGSNALFSVPCFSGESAPLNPCVENLVSPVVKVARCALVRVLGCSV